MTVDDGLDPYLASPLDCGVSSAVNGSQAVPPFRVFLRLSKQGFEAEKKADKMQTKDLFYELSL